MKKLDFPLLTADQIECRIGQLNKDQTKANLLLYKDARCDMSILDNVVGAYNWQREHKEIKGCVYCGVSIWDEDKKCWITKWDAGKEGSIEAEKSASSDSFKRSCVCIGIGRELYTAPQIWVAVSSKYDAFYVKSISYNENREIDGLEITNDKKEIVYTYGKFYKKPTQKVDTPTPMKASIDYVKAVKDYFNGLPIDRQDRFLKNVIIAEFNLNELNDIDYLVAQKIYIKYQIGGRN